MVSNSPALTVRPVTAKRKGCIRWRAPFSFSAARPRTASSIAVSVHSGESCEAFHELGKVLADELFAELFLELCLVVFQRAAVEVADGVGDLGRQGDTLLEEAMIFARRAWSRPSSSSVSAPDSTSMGAARWPVLRGSCG